MNVLHVVGARPNFMKAAPVYRALEHEAGIAQAIVHTGQHFDANMSQIFFRELGMREPDLNLQAGSRTHGRQTAAILEGIESVLLERRPDLVLVYGDVNSTMAAALAAAKLRIPVAHVEAGLRSFDRRMPEEINRVVTDCLGEMLFTPSEDAGENLAREGVPPERIFFAGNVMIDTLLRLLPAARERLPRLVSRFGWREFGLVTLHRPSNVDDPETFSAIFDALAEIGRSIPLIFPAHPRARLRLGQVAPRPGTPVLVVEPLGYTDFLALEQQALVVITDSGGVQEETTCLGVPCLTLRENTERPVTVTLGTNILVGRDVDRLKSEVRRILSGRGKRGTLPPLWDGQASRRIARAIGAFARGGFPCPAKMAATAK